MNNRHSRRRGSANQPPVPQHNNVAPQENERQGVENIDQDVYRDRLTMGIIRNPVVGSCGGVYDARSFRDIVAGAGMSLVNPVHRLTSAVYVPALKNTIDNLFGEHEDRIEDYELQPVMAEIHRLLPQNHQVGHSAIVTAIEAALEIIKGLSLTACWATGMSMMLMMTPFVNVVALFAVQVLVGGNMSIYDTFNYAKSLAETTLTTAIPAFCLSTVGLFAGRKAGIFPERPVANHAHAAGNRGHAAGM